VDQVVIFDTTLRDGEQSPGATLNIEEKMEVAKQLAKLGVDVIEAGFPYSSPGDAEAVRRISQEVRGPVICGLARAIADDIDCAWESLREAERARIHTFISTSDIHLQHQFRKSREQVLTVVREMVGRAKSYVEDVEFSAMDASRSDPQYLYAVLEAAIDAGATTVNIPDTVGYAMTDEFGALIAGIKANVPNIARAIISVHCHNDLGLATANSLAAVANGARQIECTVNGIGERAGNASLEEVVMALKTRRDIFTADTQINTKQIYKSSRLVSSLTGILVQPNKAVVGANAFAHESGIHQDGLLKERSTYEIMDARAVGLVESQLVMGKHSGKHAFAEHLKDLGYDLSDEDLKRAFAQFKELADKKKVVSDRDLEAIVANQARASVEIYHLDHIQVSCGDHSLPTATVVVTGPAGESLTDATVGTGPVDAVYKAIDRIVGMPVQLLEYSVQSVTAGIDAIGEVSVRVTRDGRIFSGHGADTDIITASAKAYMNAVNKVLGASGFSTGPSCSPTKVEEKK
jgi:2-isopropylmalate synthase